jgi:DNA polymerase-3 subunit epsilon
VSSRLDVGAIAIRVRPHPLPSRLTVDEREAHVTFVATLGDSAIWREYLRDRDLARSA